MLTHSSFIHGCLEGNSLLVDRNLLLVLLEKRANHVDRIGENSSGEDNNDDNIYSLVLVLRCDIPVTDCDHCNGGVVDR